MLRLRCRLLRLLRRLRRHHRVLLVFLGKERRGGMLGGGYGRDAFLESEMRCGISRMGYEETRRYGFVD